MSLQDMMAGFDDAPMGTAGVYLKPGSYLLKIIEAKNGHAQEGGFDFFVAEFEVMASDNPQYRPGMRVEWMVAFKVPQYKKTYQADVKQFLFNAFRGFDQSVTQEQITNQVWALATSPQQPLAGKFIGATAVDKPKKTKPGETFTKVTFHEWAGPAPTATGAPAT